MISAKKLASFFLVAGIAVFAAAAQSPALSYKRALVAYFSMSGRTAQLAQTIADTLGCDLFELEPAVPYTDEDINWRDSSCRSAAESRDSASRPAIAKLPDISRYDMVVIAFPIWWHDAPKVIYTFIEACDLSGKKVVPVCTSGGSELGNIAESLSAAASPSAVWLRGMRFNVGASASEVRRFFDRALAQE